MPLTPEAKDIILNYLKDGNRDMALQYINRMFRTSQYDSQKLLEAVEYEFSDELKSGLPPKSATGCSGCLTTLLKVISILLLIAGVGVFAIGYFFIDLFGHEWNNRKVPVVITGFVNPYADTTYAYAFLVYKFDKNGQTQIDTTTMDYHKSYNHIGDTIQLSAKDIGLPLDAETISRMKKTQQFIYAIGGCATLAAVIFWLVTSVFKTRPPSRKVAGRYMK